MKILKKEEMLDHIGYAPAASPWFTITQENINQFAELTLDKQYIHVDPDKAKDTPFGSTIAHGFNSLALISYFGESFCVVVDGAHTILNYGLNKVRFMSPVKVNSKIRAKGILKDVMEKNPGQFMFTYEVTIEIEGEHKPALVAEWLNLQLID